ncbi:hypothetical protein WAI453_004594 [Rhynchosporium graminicola]
MDRPDQHRLAGWLAGWQTNLPALVTVTVTVTRQTWFSVRNCNVLSDRVGEGERRDLGRILGWYNVVPRITYTMLELPPALSVHSVGIFRPSCYYKYKDFCPIPQSHPIPSNVSRTSSKRSNSRTNP